MKIKIIAFLFLYLCYSSGTIAQANCPSTNLYKTKFLNDGKDSSRLSFPLNFIITADSIIVSFDAKGKDQFFAFRIMNKECFWNEDFSEGKSVYKLMLGDLRGNKYPTLNISSSKKQPLYIELLYENSEKRVFTQ